MSSLRAQSHFFLSKCHGSIMFFQVGRFYEFYDGQAQRAGRLLGLRQIESRRGFQSQCGFPVNLKDGYAKRFLRLGFSVHIVKEADHRLQSVKTRSVAKCWERMANSLRDRN